MPIPCDVSHEAVTRIGYCLCEGKGQTIAVWLDKKATRDGNLFDIHEIKSSLKQIVCIHLCPFEGYSVAHTTAEHKRQSRLTCIE